MSVAEYGPGETWPTHQKPYWKDALKQARAAGWTLRHLGAPHWFGVVVCPTGDHSFSVDSTARGAETIAKEVPKRLRECPHGAAPRAGAKVADRALEADRLLTSAERLVDAASWDLDLARARDDVLAELDRLELLLRSAELTVDHVLAVAQEEALSRAVELEGVPDAKAIDETLTEAEMHTDAAEAVVTRIRRTGVAQPLSARAELIRRRIGDVRSRLDDM